MNNIINVLKAIADKNRLTILLLLSQKSLCVCDLQPLVPLTQGALSTQLKNLSTAGLLSSTKRGKWVFYELNKTMPKAHKSLLTKIFKEIENDPFIKNLMQITQNINNCKNC